MSQGTQHEVREGGTTELWEQFKAEVAEVAKEAARVAVLEAAQAAKETAVARDISQISNNPFERLFSGVGAGSQASEIALENFRVNLADYVNNLKEPYVITKYGDPLAVVLPFELYRNIILKLSQPGVDEVLSRDASPVYDDDDSDSGE